MLGSAVGSEELDVAARHMAGEREVWREVFEPFRQLDICEYSLENLVITSCD